MTKERFDIHQHMTDKIVGAIEYGARDFRRLRHRSAGSTMRPVNLASKKGRSQREHGIPGFYKFRPRACQRIAVE